MTEKNFFLMEVCLLSNYIEYTGVFTVEGIEGKGEVNS